MNPCPGKYKRLTTGDWSACINQRVVFSLYRQGERPIKINARMEGIHGYFLSCRPGIKFGKKWIEVGMRFPLKDVKWIKNPVFCKEGWRTTYQRLVSNFETKDGKSFIKQDKNVDIKDIEDIEGAKQRLDGGTAVRNH